MAMMSNSNGLRCDDETGELLTYYINEETGEQSLIHKSAPLNTTSFRKKCKKRTRFLHGYMCKTKKYQTLKNKILSGSNIVSYRMLLTIPTLTIFPSVVCVILILLEIYLHVRCHKKNKMSNNSNVYYQSPFHVVTSTFCGLCRDCQTASKVTALQDKRRYYRYHVKNSSDPI